MWYCDSNNSYMNTTEIIINYWGFATRRRSDKFFFSTSKYSRLLMNSRASAHCRAAQSIYCPWLYLVTSTYAIVIFKFKRRILTQHLTSQRGSVSPREYSFVSLFYWRPIDNKWIGYSRYSRYSNSFETNQKQKAKVETNNS